MLPRCQLIITPVHQRVTFAVSGNVKHLQQPRARDDGQGDPGHARRETPDREGVPGKYFPENCISDNL